MNEKDFIRAVSDNSGQTQKVVKEVMEAFKKEVVKALQKREDIIFKSFGVFKVSKRKARTGYNVATGAKMTIPAKEKPVFKFSKKVEI